MCQAINVIIIEKVFCILCNQLIPIINGRIFSFTILYTQKKSLLLNMILFYPQNQCEKYVALHKA